MSTRELATEQPKSTGSSRRVVEAEIRLPKLDDLRLPEIDLEPVRTAAEQVLLTGIGVGVLVARGLANAIKAAHRAGAEAAQDPGPVTRALLSLVRKPEKGEPTKAAEARVKVPGVTVDNYDRLPRQTSSNSCPNSPSRN